MFAYDDLVQWCKDMRSAQIARRNRAWNFQHAHGIDPCDVAWNADAIRLSPLAVSSSILCLPRDWLNGSSANGTSLRGTCVPVG